MWESPSSLSLAAVLWGLRAISGLQFPPRREAAALRWECEGRLRLTYGELLGGMAD